MTTLTNERSCLRMNAMHVCQMQVKQNLTKNKHDSDLSVCDQSRGLRCGKTKAGAYSKRLVPQQIPNTIHKTLLVSGSITNERGDMHVLPHMSSVPSSLSFLWSSIWSVVHVLGHSLPDMSPVESVNSLNASFKVEPHISFPLRSVCMYILSEPREMVPPYLVYRAAAECLCLQHNMCCRHGGLQAKLDAPKGSCYKF